MNSDTLTLGTERKEGFGRTLSFSIMYNSCQHLSLWNSRTSVSNLLSPDIIYTFHKILRSTTVFNMDNNEKSFLSNQISILE